MKKLQVNSISIQRTRRRLGFLSIVAVALVLLGEAVVAREVGLAFTVLRDGDSIGSHEIAFRKEGDELHVEVAIDLQVKLAFLTLFRYRHSNHEVWRAGRLVSIETRTDDDGELFQVSGRATAEGFLVQGNEGRILAPDDVLPTSYWHPETVERGLLLDSQRGRLVEVQSRALGPEKLDGPTGQPVMRYRMSGDLDLDLWYDSGGTWRKLAFTARGSPVTYIDHAGLPTADELARRQPSAN